MAATKTKPKKRYAMARNENNSTIQFQPQVREVLEDVLLALRKRSPGWAKKRLINIAVYEFCDNIEKLTPEQLKEMEERYKKFESEITWNKKKAG